MDIKFITKSVTVTRGLPEQVERIQELEAEIERLRKGFVWLDDTIEGHLLLNPENKDSKLIQEMKRKISFILSNGEE